MALRLRVMVAHGPGLWRTFLPATTIPFNGIYRYVIHLLSIRS